MVMVRKIEPSILIELSLGPYKGHFIDAFRAEVLSKSALLSRIKTARVMSVNSSTDVYTRLLRNLIEECNQTGQAERMLNALNQSIAIHPQQEELVYRIMIHINHTGNLDQAASGSHLILL